ncbi:MAG: TonB-dependent receptor [Chlorobi bacterium]|nr:TonB-dependent receptor [Chlorobiota bacterium]
MLRQAVVLFIVFLSLSGHLTGQNAVIEGLVSDSATKEPLPGVNVILDKTTGVSTDDQGKYRIELVPGTHELVFSFIGYQSFQKTVTVTKNQEVSLNVLLKSKAVDLDVAVITAGKFEQRLSDITVSMSVMKPAFIENINTIKLDRTLNYLPGLDILDGQASIRGGGGYSYGAGSRVSVLIDGLPILTASEGEVKWNYLPVENIAQVEVLKGASSALYGSSALNGIINIRTAYPGLEPETKITVYSGFTMKPKRREMAWWWDNLPVTAGASFLYMQQFGSVDIVAGGNGYINQGYRTDNFDEQARINLKFRHRPKNVKGLSYGANTNMQWQHRSDFFIWMDADSGAFIQNPASVSANSGIRFNIDPWVTYFHGNNNRHSLKTRFYRVTNGFKDSPDKDNASDLFYGEYQYQKKFRNRLMLTAGVAEQYGTANAELYGNHFSNTFSLYGQLDYTFFGKLSTTLGLRWEQYSLDNAQKESSPVIRAGVNYQVARSTFIRASFGQGYRYPSIAEKYTATSLGNLNIFPNPDLASEKGWSAEVGARQGFRISDWYGFFDMALFRMEYENMIEFTFGVYKPDSVDVPTLDDVGFKSLNVGKARITGIEIDLTGNGRIGNVPLKLFMGYTYMNPQDLSADTVSILKYRYKHSFKGDVEFNFKRFSTGISFIYQSFMERIDKAFEEKILGIEIFPGLKEYREKNNTGAVVFDLRASYLFTPATRVSLIAKNIFNKEYMGRPGDIQPPRSITLQVLVDF